MNFFALHQIVFCWWDPIPIRNCSIQILTFWLLDNWAGKSRWEPTYCYWRLKCSVQYCRNLTSARSCARHRLGNVRILLTFAQDWHSYVRVVSTARFGELALTAVVGISELVFCILDAWQNERTQKNRQDATRQSKILTVPDLFSSAATNFMDIELIVVDVFISSLYGMKQQAI